MLDNINWNLFSIHRKVLMGGAILLIMLYHSYYYTHNSVTRIFVTGKMGVEFFLFLSGIGLYFSLKKKNDLKDFYKRRLLRILPEYLIVAVPVYLIYSFQKGLSPLDFFINISTINFFWGDGLYFWFIHMIVISYLLTPFYFKIVDSRHYNYIIPIAILGLTYAIYFFYRDYPVMLRFASFFLGLGLGKKVYQKREIKCGRCIILMAPFILFFCYVSTFHGEIDGIWLEPFYYFWLTIPLLIYMCFVLKANSIVYRMFNFLGGITLELYLLHEMFFLKGCKMLFSGNLVPCIVSILTVIPFAWLLSKLNGKILRLIHK